MNTPLVSVILPVYNAEDFIAYSISSILNQTFLDFELIVINDGSSDQSEQIILSFQDERIRYYKNNSNLKLIETLNRGLAFAKGKYIARIDADDVCYPDRFEKQVVFLENNPEYGIVGSFAETFGNKQEVLKYVEEDEDIRYALITHNPFIHSTVMIRTSVLKDHHLKYKADQLHVEDYDLWIRMMKYSKGKILPEILVGYRSHNEQISNLNSSLQFSNAKKIQSLYLIELGFEIEEAEFVSLLMTDYSFNIKELIDFSDKLATISQKLPFTGKQDSFKRTLESKIRNQIIEKKQLTINECISLINTKKILTLKQKFSFILKLFFIKHSLLI